jgi:predicted nucleotidyltransferase
MELDFQEIFKEFNRLKLDYLDIIFDSPIPYDELKKRVVMIEISGKRIPTISIPDLIKLKERSGRKQDLSDVEYLKMILER